MHKPREANFNAPTLLPQLSGVAEFLHEVHMGNLQVQDVADWAPSSINLSDMTRVLSAELGLSETGSRERRIILDILFTSAVVISNGSLDIGNTIWVREASNRAMEVLCLILLVGRKKDPPKRPLRANPPLVRAACTLAGNYRSIMEPSIAEVLPCERLLGDIVLGLIEIFNTSEGHLKLDMSLGPVRMDALCRSALILIVSELVISVLKCALERMSGGTLSISLSCSAHRVGTLIVKTPSTLGLTLSSRAYEIVCTLSGVLKAELLYREVSGAGSTIEFRFPCAA
jgi:hypothetical protein